MIPVRVTGVYMNQEEGWPPQHFVKLAAEDGRQFHIWIGQFEAWAISYGLEKAPTERPMTLDLMANLLREAGATLEAVHITALRETTFYAVLKLRFPDGLRDMDARPSDALALAVRTDSPILASPEVIENAGTAPAPGKAVPAVQMAPVIADERAVRELSSAILREAIQQGADEVVIGRGRFVSADIVPDNPAASRIYFEDTGPSVHVLHRVKNEWEEAMSLPGTVLKPLAGRFLLMATYGQDPLWHVPIAYQDRMYDAQVTVTPGQFGEGIHIALREKPQQPSGTD